jgi:ABC-type multidrug transport system fused ATPase/permease subunit
MKLHVGISSNGDVDVGEINLAEMDPEDIRVRISCIENDVEIFSVNRPTQ